MDYEQESNLQSTTYLYYRIFLYVRPSVIYHERDEALHYMRNDRLKHFVDYSPFFDGFSETAPKIPSDFQPYPPRHFIK